MVYFDNSATTQVLEPVAQRVYRAMTELYYNPAAAYGAAFTVEKEVTAARRFAASVLHISAEDLYYTSGGTESNNIAIFGTLRASRLPNKQIVTTMAEHASVFETIRAAAKLYNAEIVYAPLNADGTVAVDRLHEVLNENTALVSIMHINNELGSINNLIAIGAKVRTYAPNAVFHSDGVQAFPKYVLPQMPCDLYSVSAHKFHAPKGIGMLCVRSGIRNAGGQIGGGQERNFRSGTSNVPGILGTDTALKLYTEHIVEWRRSMEAVKLRLYNNLMKLPDVQLNGPAVEAGAAHIINMSFNGVRGEVLLHALEQKGVLVSTGSACSAKKLGKNRILHSVGIDGTRQEGAVRFSFCPYNTLEEADYASDCIADAYSLLRRYRRR